MHPFVLISHTDLRFDGKGGLVNIDYAVARLPTGAAQFFGIYAPAVLLLAFLTYLWIELPWQLRGAGRKPVRF